MAISVIILVAAAMHLSSNSFTIVSQGLDILLPVHRASEIPQLLEVHVVELLLQKQAEIWYIFVLPSY